MTQAIHAQNISYPNSLKGNVSDTYFGKEIKDPYRWLEDDLSYETKAWVLEQNKVAFVHLEKIPFRQDIVRRLTAMWNYERISAPFKKGKNTYFYKNNGLQNQSVLYKITKKG